MRRSEVRLPSLKALKVFDAVMRQNSLRAAADALFITPQAVGQQMKTLEDQLQVPLFRRMGRTIIPTEEAVILARYIDNGLQDFEEGIKVISSSQRTDRINVNATPYFATRFLIPRLRDFQRIRSRCDIRLKTNVELPDFTRDDIDVSIQWGFSDWGEYESRFLFPDYKILCYSPLLAQGNQTIRKPDDILKHTLLQLVRSHAVWENVLAFLGARSTQAKRTIGFYDNESMRQAAVEGLGVGLVSEWDAKREIQLGTLIAPFGEDIFHRMPAHHVPGFYLVYPKSRERIPSVQEFCRWILSLDWQSGG